ncbi:zinc finger protein 235-like [Prorops nasuta]|uniref:zinc finger protein 235-like n=1 Tax=Prorops nasuta TaxID=863751 RepID=UPI0034CF216D
MCARLLTCPLCSQPGFLNLDALRAGLVSVSTRPLGCPVCNEILLGIDKLTIHLFSHTISLNNNINEVPRTINIITNANNLTSGNIQDSSFEDWNVQKTQQIEKQKTIILKSIHPVNNLINIENKPTNFTRPEAEICHQNPQVLLQTKSCEQGQTNVFQITNCNHISENITKSSKLDITSQYYFDNNVKNLSSQKISQENFSNCGTNWIQTLPRLPCEKSSVLTVQTENVQKPKESEESNTEVPSINSVTKSTEFSNFQSFSCVKPNHIEPVIESVNKQPILYNSKASVASVNVLGLNNPEILNDSSTKDIQNLSNSEIINTVQCSERCNICGFQFSDQSILILHKKLVHMIDEKDCNSKPEDFLKSYPCHLCSKVFKMRGSLMVHMRVAHIGYNSEMINKNGKSTVAVENGYKCPTCGKGFKKEQHVVQHLKTHEGKQWECNVCSKMFTTKYFLKKHKRLHSGEMPYKCNICDKTFTFQQSYHKHKLYHMDDKPHTCGICNRSFKELSTLHNHERIHTGEKPFACETCGKCFRQRVSYLVHRRIHTGAMPYKCLKCSKSFRYKVSQRTHKCIAQNQSENSAKQTDDLDQTIEKSDANTSNDLHTSQETNQSQQPYQPDETNQSSQPIIYNEDNRYVLIINAQGQHVLRKESDIENTKSQFENSINEFSNINVVPDAYKGTWTSSLKDDSTTKIPLEISPSQSDETLPTIPNTPIESSDSVFPVIVRTLENTSLEEKEILLDSCNNYKQSHGMQINEISTSPSSNFTINNNNSSPLQTINEESLNELLRGINRE